MSETPVCIKQASELSCSARRHGFQRPRSVVLHDVLRCVCISCKLRPHLPASKETRLVPDKGLGSSAVDAGDGPPHSLWRGRRATKDAQNGTHGIIITLPEANVLCVLCRKYVGTVLKADCHFKSTHGDVEVRYECGGCRIVSGNYHSVSCHIPKCRGTVVPSKGGFPSTLRCEACGRGFRSAIAVSTHERHAHPSMRNEKRVLKAQLRKGSNRWTGQEVALLMQLMEESEGVPEAIRRVAERFPGRGYEAVRSKICRLCLTQNTRRVEVAEPDLMSWLLSPKQSKAIRTGLRERLIQLAGTYISSPGDAHTHVIGEWLRGADQIPILVETAAQSLLAGFGPRVVSHRVPPHVSSRRNRPQTLRKTTAAWRQAMRQHQLLYARDRSALVSHILDGSPAARCQVPLSEIEEAFREKWSGHMPYRGLGHFMVPDTSENEHFSRPITSREVLDTLSSIKGITAMGPDWIGKRALLDWDPSGQKIERILNTWWFTGVIPRCLKRCRTVLLPGKEEALLADIHNWRPITIGSGLLKLYSKILTGRLAEACPLRECQRGFIHAQGCAENMELLRGVMRRRSADGRGLAIVFVDFAKAFDSVSHRHILDVLRLRGVDDHVLGVIREMYMDVTTRVENGR
ncbi:hypothetical protein AOLI_G00308410 [Acnodon oligacanthus]